MFLLRNFLAATALLCSFAAAAQSSINGLVQDEKNNPIAGAIVSLSEANVAAITAADGTFEISGLAPGRYIIRASMVNYLDVYDTIDLAAPRMMIFVLTTSAKLIDEVIVSATRVDERSGMTFSTIDKAELEKRNLGQDLPYLLNQQTAVVTTSDAGAGVGYTGIRIRGSDATRVNVTINGIPVNDAESQGTYWVDLPDIAASIESIQIQRGVGGSTNGAGAFGGSLNILTSSLQPAAYGEFSSSAGSFMTTRNSFKAGTGLINGHFSFDGRISDIRSAGFIDRASSKLQSYYLSGAYNDEKNILRFITFSGTEKTYQAWNGIPEARLKNDTAGMSTFILNNGLDAEDAANLRNSGSRTYNQFMYEGQNDNYKQDYYQLHFSHSFSKNLTLNLATHYTRGKGYYEEYRKNDAFANYGLDDIIVGTDTISSSNLIRRRWLDNHFYGGTFSLSYDSKEGLSATIGGAIHHYTGYHYGEITWAQWSLNNSYGEHYYQDTADKNDMNIFARVNYDLGQRFRIYADLQYRQVNYEFLGFDDSAMIATNDVTLSFINPKLGVSYQANPATIIYLSYSRGSKEPGRDDYTQSRPGNYPEAEFLNDIEAGARYRARRLQGTLAGYYMAYENQLIPTGALNDVGAYTRINAESSYRTGIEAEVNVLLGKKFSVALNAAASQNKIAEYTERIDNFDTGLVEEIVHKNTDIAFSPAFVAGSGIQFRPVEQFSIELLSKYVSRQYLDNTSSADRSLDPFFVNDLQLSYKWHPKFLQEIALNVKINNIFNEEYEPNGYTFGYIAYGQKVQEKFYYPQAGPNFLAGISVKF